MNKDINPFEWIILITSVVLNVYVLFIGSFAILGFFANDNRLFPIFLGMAMSLIVYNAFLIYYFRRFIKK